MKLIVSIFHPLIIGFIGSLFTASSLNNWYLYLNKPSFNPPNWIFGPAWTLLYLLMGLAFYFIWKKGYCKKCFYIYFIQLFLNFLWSFLFFTLQNPLLAFLNIIVLWLAILLCIIWFYKVSKIAAYLFIPYILWVSFASILNLFIIILN
ncbi:MAG: tryptophan-rich sensory protein [Candidatus Pacebacteria bacterium]|nr:tryptophan-rich sensory protein [Candidatus Paceibacterota bacterium]